MSINTLFEVLSHQCSLSLLTQTYMGFYLYNWGKSFIYYQMECLWLDQGWLDRFSEKYCITCPVSTVILGHVTSAGRNTTCKCEMNFNTYLTQARYPVFARIPCNYCIFVWVTVCIETVDFKWLLPSFRCCPWSRCCGMGDFRPRTVWLGHPEKREQKYPRNVINNQKYNFFTFLPAVSVSQRSRVHLFPFLWLLYTNHSSFRLTEPLAYIKFTMLHSHWMLFM